MNVGDFFTRANIRVVWDGAKKNWPNDTYFYRFGQPTQNKKKSAGF